MTRRAAVIAAIRTPVGRYGGALSGVRPDDLAAGVIAAVVNQTGIDPTLIEDVYLGSANQAGEDNRNVARMAALLAGLPASVPGSTVNRLCASGLEAINIAARMIETNHGDAFIAGGVESMSRAPLVMSKAETAFDRTQQIYDTSIGWRFINPRLAEMYHPYAMGETAENVARKHNISRDDQDQFALQSQLRWHAAHQAGKFRDEIAPVEIPQRKGDPVVVDTDEHPRPGSTVEKLAGLRAIMGRQDPDATVTAGNASGQNDGASAAIVASAAMVAKYGLTPLATLSGWGIAGVAPNRMGIGPVPAVAKVLNRAELSLKDIDLIELNEAFAAQALACTREWKLAKSDFERVNPLGSGISLGHPVGATGGRILATMLNQMQRSGAKTALETMCIGGGQGLAALFRAA